MDTRFREGVSTVAQFRVVFGHPTHRVLRKQVEKLDDHCRAFIAKCPFLLIASSGGEGNMGRAPKAGSSWIYAAP